MGNEHDEHDERRRPRPGDERPQGAADPFGDGNGYRDRGTDRKKRSDRGGATGNQDRGTDQKKRSDRDGANGNQDRAEDGGDIGIGHPDRAGDAEGPRLFSTTGIVAACAGFVLLGALQAYFGPAIPALRARFGLAPSGAGLALSMFYGGAVVGVLVGGTIHRRVGNGALLFTSFLLMAVGAVGFALSGNWLLALASSLVSGFGAGGMDYGLNQLFSIGFGRRSPAMLSVLNAHYGVGAIAGPLVISLLGGHNYPYAFAGTAALLIVAGLVLRTVRDGEPRPDAAPSGGGGRTRIVIPIIVMFLALYALQVAVETGVGAWEPTYLQLLGRGAGYAANATSVYWLMLTVGRFLVAPLTLRWSEPTIVAVSCVGTTVCLAFAAIPALAPYALAGVGLFNAPVFPAALPWLNRVAPDVRWAGTGAILAANLGGVAAGPLLGLAIEVFGGGSVPWTLTITSAVCVALVLRLRATASDTPSATV